MEAMSEERQAGVELYFETDDVEGARDLLRRRGVRFVHDIFEQPWGQRVFRVYDPDMYIVEFGEPIEAVIKRSLSQGMSVEDTAARTSMPLDIVVQTAKKMH
jgi:catechol 2,3-dioxygenase-like lactoylglutathione lyase family enzyme